MSKNSKKTEQVDILDNLGSAMVDIKVQEKDLYHTIKFLEEDAIDTYNAMKQNKWNKLPPKQKKTLKNASIYLENTNIAITFLNEVYNGSIKLIEEKLEKWKQQQKEIKLLTKNDIIK